MKIEYGNGNDNKLKENKGKTRKENTSKKYTKENDKVTFKSALGAHLTIWYSLGRKCVEKGRGEIIRFDPHFYVKWPVTTAPKICRNLKCPRSNPEPDFSAQSAPQTLYFVRFGTKFARYLRKMYFAANTGIYRVEWTLQKYSKNT